MRTRRLLVVGTVLALAAGCSSESPAPPAGGPPAGATSAGASEPAPAGLPDACSLLTRAEVTAATGHPFGEGAVNTTVSQASISACDWPGPGIGTVQVLVSTVNAYDTSKQTAASVYGSADDIAIPGAARAYVVKGGFLLAMDMGKTFLQVSYITADAGVADAVRELAPKAAARLT